MSHTEQIIDRFARQQGWDLNTQLDLALRYIEDQGSPDAFEDFLVGIAETENSMDADPRWKCSNCGDAITFDPSSSPQVWVGSDGEITCPLSDRPHGPAVPDDVDEHGNPTGG